MSVTSLSPIMEAYQEKFRRDQEQKLLQEALLYLKLREVGCPKLKALIFTKKKQKCIDGTVQKDGPAGYRKLKPEKPTGNITHGWLKGGKLKYVGVRGYSQQIKRNQSHEKKEITAFNHLNRKEMQIQRKKHKIEKQKFLNTGESKILMEQIGNLKDQFLKDRQKRNLFFSYNGTKLEQYTKQFFDNLEDLNPNSLIVQMAAFDNPINDEKMKLETDWELAKGRSLSTPEVQAQGKRNTVLNCRRSLSNFQIPKIQRNDKFRTTLSNSQKRTWPTLKGGKSLSKQKKYAQNKQFRDFQKDLVKLVLIKTKGIEIK